MKFTVTLDGVAALVLDLKKLDAEMKRRIATWTKNTGQKVADQSKKNLTDNRSVVTGTLRRSMTSIFYDEGCYAESGTNVEYAPHVEFGHKQTPGRYVHAIARRLQSSFVPAKPFLTPAFNRYAPVYLRGLIKILKEILPREY